MPRAQGHMRTLGRGRNAATESERPPPPPSMDGGGGGAMRRRMPSAESPGCAAGLPEAATVRVAVRSAVRVAAPAAHCQALVPFADPNSNLKDLASLCYASESSDSGSGDTDDGSESDENGRAQGAGGVHVLRFAPPRSRFAIGAPSASSATAAVAGARARAEATAVGPGRAAPFLGLTSDVLLYVCEWLPDAGVARLMRVCTAWSKALRQAEPWWRRRCQSTLADTSPKGPLSLRRDRPSRPRL